MTEKIKSYIFALLIWEVVVVVGTGLTAVLLPSYDLGEMLWPNKPEMSVGAIERKLPSQFDDHFQNLYDTAFDLRIAQDMIDRGLGLVLLGPIAAICYAYLPKKAKAPIVITTAECDIPYVLE